MGISPFSTNNLVNFIIVLPSSSYIDVFFKVWLPSDIRVAPFSNKSYFRTVFLLGLPMIAWLPDILPPSEMAKPIQPSLSTSRRPQRRPLPDPDGLDGTMAKKKVALESISVIISNVSGQTWISLFVDPVGYLSLLSACVTGESDTTAVGTKVGGLVGVAVEMFVGYVDG